MTPEQLVELDWKKGNGLLPVVVQHAHTGAVLMVASMNREALHTTLAKNQVTFFSRSRNRLWTKGESSGHFLDLVSITADCDNDTLLVKAEPRGPTCHKGTDTCFGDMPATDANRLAFLLQLESIIEQRINAQPDGSYTAKIWAQGPARLAQKVGEEGVEVALAAVTQDEKRLVSEAADLLFHLTLLLKSKQLGLADVVEELERRHAERK
jgi:phosphoribosyl-ATP pyrophosphohydrolase/phosphoribosyl-AMP cyclohydrolase